MAGYSVPAAGPIRPTIATCYENQVAIAPADATAIGPYQALYIGVSGDVTLVPRNTTTPVLYKNLVQGTILRVAFQGVNATGTTATNLIALG